MTGTLSRFALRPVAWSMLLIAMPGCIGGCGGAKGPERKRVYQVKGVLSMDGKPYGPAQLTVHPAVVDPGDLNYWIPGRADDKGELTFMTYRQNDGLPEGEYHFAIKGFSQQNPVPKLYQNQGSPLVAKIEPKKGNEIKLDMDSEADEKAEEEAAKREGRKYIPKAEREKLKLKMQKKR